MQSQKQAAAAAAASAAASSAATNNAIAATANIATDNASTATRNQLRPYKYDYADSFACTYIVSVIGAANAELVTYPLDLTKTRLQIQGEGFASAQQIAGKARAQVRYIV